jgi:hypothetical protein
MQAADSKMRLKDQRREILVSAAVGSTETLARLHPESGATYKQIGGGYAVFHSPGDFANRWLESDGDGNLHETQLDQIEQFFRSRNSPVRIVVADEEGAPELVRLLEKRQYERGPGMVTWWRSLPASHLPPISEEFRVSRATAERMEYWAHTVVAGFREDRAPIADSGIEAWEVRNFSARATSPNCYPFLAVRGAQLAGGGILQMKDDVGLLRTASTRFLQRNRGVQSALIAARLTCASEAGCKVAFSIANADSPSERNLQRFGFTFLQKGCVFIEP